MVTRAVFLDRDGVINANVERDGKAVAPTRLEDFRFLPGVGEAIGALKKAGFTIIVITNQPDLATGRTSQATVDAMHDKIRAELQIDGIKMCAHLNTDNCHCRKPKPGMLLDAAAEWGIDLSSSYLVGDRWRDMEAGRAAGCKTLFVDHGYEQEGSMQPDKIISSLIEAAAAILEGTQTGDRT
ncbi:D-glycero-alpha-D-manno-heptose-1,7-bisphosphate 7-phosphatase [Methyloceanibacter sp.]|uniref:D-glycero-alpha-D-manno-heptose-1,7-bisphosphate 7-phosphatase n=1 Tax=Methyloceanibacter sp. TaxID=1965321 RepID=UPI003D6D3225